MRECEGELTKIQQNHLTAIILSIMSPNDKQIAPHQRTRMTQPPHTPHLPSRARVRHLPPQPGIHIQNPHIIKTRHAIAASKDNQLSIHHIRGMISAGGGLGFIGNVGGFGKAFPRHVGGVADI